jgi:NAD(P)-dependent dehydrogenase (short-subunit alcohol dehydrogenase family)
MGDFDGLVAPVTGGGSGIGRSTAELLAGGGARVAGTAGTLWVRRLHDSAPDPAAELAAPEARQSHGRLVSAEEIAGSIAYLASPLSGSTTGTVLAVDGGMDALRLRPRG